MSIQELFAPRKAYTDLDVNSIATGTIEADLVDATLITADRIQSPVIEGQMNITNSFAYLITTATSNPGVTNGFASLINGVLGVNVAGASCTITLPTASQLNSAIPGTSLDNAAFTLYIYNRSATAIMIFPPSVGLFPWVTNTTTQFSVANVRKEFQIRFVRTAIGNFWDLYYDPTGVSHP